MVDMFCCFDLKDSVVCLFYFKPCLDLTVVNIGTKIIVHCTVIIVQRTKIMLQCTMIIVQCTMIIVQCTMIIVQLK